MSLPAIVMWAVVALIGIPSAWKNPTAAALVISWIVGEVVFLATGNNLPVELYLYPDIFVIAVIFCKREWQACDDYGSTWHQFLCLTIERSPADRCVLFFFPIMWAVYVAPIDAYSQWWILWSAVILQFLFASAESLEMFWRARREQITPSSSDNVSRFAWAGGDG